ncbi:MAG: type II toxin-antitoxin system VapC family toxin [Nitrososphaeria archaeon]
MYVLDSSIFASVLLKDEYYDAAVNFIKRHFKEENITVELAFIEVANALWKHTYVLKRIPEDRYPILRDSIKSLISDVAQVYSSLDILGKSIDNAIKFGLTVHDSLYFTLALEGDVNLLLWIRNLLGRLLKRDLRILCTVKFNNSLCCLVCLWWC